jgi:hypothetical protein
MNRIGLTFLIFIVDFFLKKIIISFLDTAEKPTHDPKPKRLPTRPKFGLGRKKTSELGPARTSLTSSDSKQRRTRKFCDQQGIKVNTVVNRMPPIIDATG